MYTKHCGKCGSLEYLNLFPGYYDKVQKNIESFFVSIRPQFLAVGTYIKCFIPQMKYFGYAHMTLLMKLHFCKMRDGTEEKYIHRL